MNKMKKDIMSKTRIIKKKDTTTCKKSYNEVKQIYIKKERSDKNESI